MELEQANLQLRAELDTLRKQRDEVQDQLNRIVEITAGIIYVLNPDGLFTFVNNAVEEILHFEPGELIGKHFSCIMLPDEYEKVGRAFVLPKMVGKITGLDRSPKLFDERRTGHRKTKNLEVHLVTKEQREVKVFLGNVAGIIAAEGSYDNAIAGTVKNKGSAFIGSQGIIFDITRFRSAEKEKFEIQKRLFEVQRMDALGRLAGGIAHDFNNKLATILGCADMLKQMVGKGNKELDACLDPIISASWHAADLTNNLLDFSTKNKYQMVSINIHNIINTVIELLEHTGDRRIRIAHDLRVSHPTLVGNPSRLQSLVLNLAMNACDAMEGGGELSISTSVVSLDKTDKAKHPHIRLPGKYLCLSIKDNGRGMDDTRVGQLLNSFHSPETIGPGIGLGLASAFGCIRDHEGSLEITSSLDNGTTFKVYLPFHEIADVAQSTDVTRDEAVHGTGTILLIDDEDTLRDMTKKMLTELGYSVTCCRDGDEAVDYYSAHASEIDLVILDMVMPKLSGRDCFKKLKELNSMVRAVLFTGYSFNEETDAILKEGVQGFVHKPFDLAHLSEVVARVIKA
ncbi:MAG: response regulator [Chitinispirillaceae bacterium]|jgi:PAS domain S-box-containing protein|nr:response regulator [Chitinispirillaceae bacterium]